MKKKAVTVSFSAQAEERPIALLVQMASRYDSSVYIDYKSKHVNAKSIMGMMALALQNGDDVDVVTDGVDEETAVEDIGRYLMGEFAAV